LFPKLLPTSRRPHLRCPGVTQTRDAVCVTNLRLHVREPSSEAQMVVDTSLQVIAATTDLRLRSDGRGKAVPPNTTV
jgi:hypothetical protein